MANNIKDDGSQMKSSDDTDAIFASMVGTLPPLKGISQYCEGLFNELKTLASVEFITFCKLYPRFLYPGGLDTDGDDERNDDSIKIHGYDPRTWVSVGLKLKGSVVHAQWWSFPLFPAYFSILLLSKIKSKRIIITVHNVTPHENPLIGRITTNILLSMADRVIVHSNSNKDSLLEVYSNLSPSKVVVIPHGVLSPAGNIYSLEQARQILGIPKSSKVVLFFGNIRPYKGLDTLLKAVFSAQKQVPDLRLIIAGRSWQDWGKYQELISELNLNDILVIKNQFIPTKEIGLYFSAADLVILPYKTFDAQSGVGLTALNYGKPLIVTKEGGMGDLVSDDLALLDSDDSTQMSERLVKIFSEPIILNKLAEDSKINAKKFSWSSIAHSTIQLYNDVIHGND